MRRATLPYSCCVDGLVFGLVVVTPSLACRDLGPAGRGGSSRHGDRAWDVAGVPGTILCGLCLRSLWRAAGEPWSWLLLLFPVPPGPRRCRDVSSPSWFSSAETSVPSEFLMTSGDSLGAHHKESGSFFSPSVAGFGNSLSVLVAW